MFTTPANPFRSFIKGLLLSLLLPFSLQAADNVIGPFSGLNNADNPAAIAPDKAQDLLNVDLSLGGKSVKKREGYGLAYTLNIATSAVHGVYEFYDASGNDIALSFNDSRMNSSINGGSPTVLFSTGPNAATYQCTDSQGFAYCANTNKNNVIKTNGVTYSFLVPASTGSMITVTPDRLVLSGFAGAPNRVDFSAAGDFTTWATGVTPTSAFNFTVSAPGSKITHITYAFNRVMWFKDNSFGFILPGSTAADWVVQTVSPNIGTLDNSSVYYQGILYFRGQDSHIWSYDGSNLVKLTRDISGTIALSQNRTSNFWTQTSQSDFQAGASSPAGWVSTSITPGSVVLDTADAVTPFFDTTQANFKAGTLTNVDADLVPGSLTLSLTSQSSRQTFDGGSDTTCSDPCSAPYYQARKVTATSSFILSSVTLNLKKTGSPTAPTLQIISDNSGSFGTLLDQVGIPLASIGTSTGLVNVVLPSSITITSGVVYWVRVQSGATCDASNRVQWYGLGIIPANSSFPCGSSNTGQASYTYNLFGKDYNTTGNFVSRSWDIGFGTDTWLWNWSYFTDTSVNPAGTSIVYQTQSSSDNVTFEALGNSVTAPAQFLMDSSRKRYLRYKATFTTSSNIATGRIDAIELQTSSRLRPGATYYSAVKNAANLTAWDTFQATKQDDGGNSTHVFSIRSSTNTFSLLSSTPAWTVIAAGAIPSISTGTFFQIRDEFDAHGGYANNPKLDDFTQNWFEGTAADKAYATYFNDAIWWSVAYGTSSSTNNRILKLDLLNQTWLLYDLASNGFYTRQNKLYFGSSSAGNIFKYGSVNNDNGSAINAYWKSKDFFGDSPFTNEDITTLSSFFSEVNNSSMTVTYTVAGSSSTSYTVPLYRNVSFGVDNRNMPQGTTGNTFSVKFGNNAADQPFEMLAVAYTTVPKSWKPGSQ